MFIRLRELRLEKGLTVEKVASVIGVDQVYYSRLELGIFDISVKQLIILAMYYGVSTDYILRLTDERVVP